MDDFIKTTLTKCPYCDKVIRKVEDSYRLPPEILAIMQQLGINIKTFKR